MKIRLQLFEFEDLPWFPNVIRRGMTDYLRFVVSGLGFYQAVVPLLQRLLDQTGTNQLIDLGSGGGGGLLPLQRALGPEVRVVATDKYPNVAAFRWLKEASGGQIDYEAAPVDATAVPARLRGCRTLFTVFHHFDEATARAVLADAVRHRAAVGVFEGASKAWYEVALIALFTVPLAAVAAPFVRPWRTSRLLFTYLVPLVPLCATWDGIASIFRLYPPEALRRLAEEVAPNAYIWEAGRVRHATGARVIYLIGYPRPGA